MHVESMIMVCYNNIALWRYAAGCVLTHGFWGWDMAWDRPNQHAYWTQQNFLTHIAHLLKLQDTQNSSQTNWLIDQFFWSWLLKRTRNGVFQPIFHQIIVKIVNFWSQIQLNQLVIQSHCVSDNTSSWFNKWATYMSIFLHRKFSHWRGLIEP